MIELLTPINDDFEDLFAKERDSLEDYFSATVPSVFGDEIRVDELFKRMARSPYGQHIRTQPLRFAKPEHVFDREKKKELLEMDVDPLLHQFETGLFAARILKHQKDTTGEWPLHYDGTPMTREEVGISILTPFGHDMGEVTEDSIKEAMEILSEELNKEIRVVGDIPYGEKTEEDRENESHVRIEIFKRRLPDVAPEVLCRMEQLIYHGEESVLHDLFEAEHIVQNFNTAYLAEKAAATEQNPLIREKLMNIRNDVHDKVTDAILGYAGQFTYVKEFVEFHKIGKTPRYRDLGRSAATYADIAESA
jgi:hypothetical protein